MKTLFKRVMIAVISLGIVIPAGYYSLTLNQSSNVQMLNFVPENSDLVIWGNYNGTQFYLYNNSHVTGAVIGMDMQNLDAGLIQASKNSTQSNGSQITIVPTLYGQYRGFSIYQLSNVSLSGLVPENLISSTLGYNLTTNTTDLLKLGENQTVYITEDSSVVAAGSLTSVKLSIDTYEDKTSFTQVAQKYFNPDANVSVYFTSSDLPLRFAVMNVFSGQTQFSMQLSNVSLARNVSLGIGALFSQYVLSNSLDGSYVNGTIAIGMTNYYVLNDVIAKIPKEYLQYL